jgi:hypothetical protein
MVGYAEANFTRFYGMFQHANDITGNAYGWMVVLVLFTIMFVSLKARYDTKRAFGASSFMIAILTIMLRIIGIVTDKVAFITIIAAGIGIVYLLINRD